MKILHPSDQQVRRGLLSLLAVGTLFSVVACTDEKELTVIAKLEVSEAGTYTLDGVSVPKGELKHAVRAKRPDKGKLQLHVVASPKASFEAVGLAMQAAQFAGAHVGIVGNERF